MNQNTRRPGLALAIVAMNATIACSSSSALPAAPTINHAVVAIVGLTATVEPLTTTPQPGLVYKLSFQLHESGGRVGATAMTQRFVFSNGATADGNFNNTPHVAPGGFINIVSSYSVYPASIPAAHVAFTISYTDDAGQAAAASAEADITRIGL